MRLPFKLPKRGAFIAWLFSKLFPQFGPNKLTARLERIEEDLGTLRLLVANLAELSGGPGWVETTTAAMMDISQRVQCMHEIVTAHHKLFEDIKRTEDMWRGGRVLSKLH